MTPKAQDDTTFQANAVPVTLYKGYQSEEDADGIDPMHKPIKEGD